MSDEEAEKEKVVEAEAEQQEATEENNGSNVFRGVDGELYDGSWKRIKGVVVRDGFGKLQTGGETFEGEWKEDAIDGKGTFEFASGAVYIGDFVKGEFSGSGRYSWPDGAFYAGEWRQNRMHGKGCYTDEDGVEWQGVFHNGLFFNGKAHVTFR